MDQQNNPVYPLAEPQNMQQPPQMPMPAPLPAQPSGSKKGLLVGLIIGAGVLLFIVFLAVAYFLFFSPSAQAAKASKQFMTAASQGDANKLYVLSKAESSDDKKFLKSVADSTKGSYKLAQKTSQNGKYYYLYDLSNAKSKYTRLIVEKQDGKWVVTSVVWGNTPLALIPGTGSQPTPTAQTTTPTPSPSTTTTAADTKTCLTQDDYKYMNFDKQPSSVVFDDTYDPAKFTSNKIDDMFFEPNSTKESVLLSVYDDWVDFAKHAENKQWKFRLEGSVYGSDAAAAASKKLANDRSEKAKSQLVSRGVPADRIIIDPPHDYSNEEQDAYAKIYRRVQVIVDPTCTASSAR